MSVGPMKGKEVFVVSPVCQKQRISFDQLYERMAEDSTIGQTDMATVFYKFRKILNQLCFKSYIVGRSARHIMPHALLAVTKEKDFKPSESISKTKMIFMPTQNFSQLKHVEFFRVAKQEKAKAKPSGGDTTHEEELP